MAPKTEKGSSVTLLWDFFGPHATGTAEHFERHLLEFLAKQAIAGCLTGTETEGEGHRATYCVTPVEHREALERALRPRRSRA